VTNRIEGLALVTSRISASRPTLRADRSHLGALRSGLKIRGLIMAKRCPSEWPAPLWVSHPKILIPLNYSFSGLGLLSHFKRSGNYFFSRPLRVTMLLAERVN